MPGPAPKHKSLRRGRHVPRNGEWVVLPDAPYEGPVPSLRGLPTDGPLSTFAKKAWDQWWGSPMAHQWDQADHPSLLRLLLLTDTFAKAARKGATRDMPLAEIRQLEDRLGLTEAGRLKLRWLLPAEDEEQTTPKPSQSGTAASMRDRLKVVSGGA